MNPLSHDFPDLIPFNTLNGKPRHHASAPQYFPQLEMIDILQFYNLRYDPTRSMFIILIYETFSVELMRIPKTQETQVSFILSLILSYHDPAGPGNRSASDLCRTSLPFQRMRTMLASLLIIIIVKQVHSFTQPNI